MAGVVHPGAGQGAHDEDTKLVASLTEPGPDYEVRYPRMPNEDSPNEAPWTRRVAQEASTMRDGMLVDHSAGATMLVSFLSTEETRFRIAGVFLIAAPFCGEGGWHIEGFELPNKLGERLPEEAPIFLITAAMAKPSLSRT